MSSPSSSSDSSDSEEEHQSAINEAHAKALALKRKRAEESEGPHKRKHDSDAEEIGSEDSDSETEDEDGEDFSPAADAALLKTLALIQKRDPSIYDSSTNVFQEQAKRTSTIEIRKTPKEKRSKAVTYKTQAAQALLEGDDADAGEQPLTHVQEQVVLRSETISAFHQAVDDVGDEEDGEGGLFILRKDITDDVEAEDTQYREYMEKEVGDIKKLLWVDEEARAAVKPDDETTAGTSKRKEQNPEEFLANYLLNRGWVDRKAKRLPTLDEVTGKGKGKQVELDLDDDLDDDFEELEEDFEATYNFRYEEPDGAKIPRYPRTIDALARRNDSKRSEKREKKKAKKEDEFQKKKEEVRRVKNQKVKDLQEKLSEIGKEGGLNMQAAKATLEALDLDGDFDPESFDKQMQALYDDDEHYAEDMEKPTWDDDLGMDGYYGEGGENVQMEDQEPAPSQIAEAPEAGPSKSKSASKKKKKKKKDDADEEIGVDADEMDADALPPATTQEDEEEWDGTEEMRKRVLNKYLDEMYKLDFNDMAGGMPTRFAYQPVGKETFGLSATEILLATDKELNTFMGMKNLAPHKKKHAWDKERANRLREFKQSITKRRWGWAGNVADRDQQWKDKRKKKSGKKEKDQRKDKPTAKSTDKAVTEDEANTGEPRRKKRKRNKDRAEAES